MWTKSSWVCRRLSGASVSLRSAGGARSGGGDSIGIGAGSTGRVAATRRGPSAPGEFTKPVEGWLVGPAHQLGEKPGMRKSVDYAPFGLYGSKALVIAP